MLLSRFPYPLEKGDKLRAYYQIKELSVDFSISLIAISDKKIDPASIQKLEKYCDAIHIIPITKWSILFNLFVSIFSNKPFQVGYFYSFRGAKKIKQLLKSIRPKYIYCQLIRTSEYIKDYHECSKTIDYMDALSKGIERRISKTNWYSKWFFKIEFKRLKLYERSIFDYFEHKTIITSQDRDFISHPDRKSIVCIPNGIDSNFFDAPELEKTFDLVFIGNLSYAPNIEAVEYIATEILAANPTLTCLIAGATPHPSVQRICKNNSQINLLGWVEDIRTAYCKGRIFVAPMMIGTGMQNKLLEAMALGIPCITTDLANNAILAKDHESILVANNSEEFNQAIQELLNNKELYAKISANGKRLVLENYSWHTATSELKKLILTDYSKKEGNELQ